MIIRSLLAPLFLLLLLGCGTGAVESGNGGPPGQFQIMGEVTYVPVEGGFYGIVDRSGTKYNPVNLPPSYQEDGLAVQVLATRAEDQMSIHMWGTLVRIVDIEKR